MQSENVNNSNPLDWTKGQDKIYDELKILQSKKLISTDVMIFFLECSNTEYLFEKKSAFKSNRIYKLHLN